MGKRNKTSRAESAPIKYEDTGVSETIAGIKGNIYRYVERGAKHEVVLGHDEDLKNAAWGFVEIAKAMSAVMPTDSENMMRQNAPIKNIALLRLAGRMRLQLINREPIPASVFRLPASPRKIGWANLDRGGVLLGKGVSVSVDIEGA